MVHARLVDNASVPHARISSRAVRVQDNARIRIEHRVHHFLPDLVLQRGDLRLRLALRDPDGVQVQLALVAALANAQPYVPEVHGHGGAAIAKALAAVMEELALICFHIDCVALRSAPEPD
eukprot:8357095-Alexandrium_andersonii.AAC.1